jgi:hypothetical protein
VAQNWPIATSLIFVKCVLNLNDFLDEIVLQEQGVIEMHLAMLGEKHVEMIVLREIIVHPKNDLDPKVKIIRVENFPQKGKTNSLVMDR